MQLFLSHFKVAILILRNCKADRNFWEGDVVVEVLQPACSGSPDALKKATAGTGFPTDCIVTVYYVVETTFQCKARFILFMNYFSTEIKFKLHFYFGGNG